MWPPAGPERGTVLDPFMGSGTVAVAAVRNLRQFIGFDISRDYVEIANERVEKEYEEIAIH